MKKILIADDDDEIRGSTKMFLQKMGYEVVDVADGQSALYHLKKSKFDLVLLDVIMPGMSGREVLERIRKDSKLKKQKVALLTVVQLSHPGKQLVAKLKPDEYFQKPIVDLKKFKNKIEKLLGRA